MKTTAERIKTNLRSGLDQKYYQSIWNQAAYTFGGTRIGMAPGITGSSNGLAYYPDLRPIYNEIGVSNRIMNGVFINLARIMSTMPEPDFKQCGAVTAAVLQAFWNARAMGTGKADGGWHTQFCQAFVDGFSFGTGVVQIGMRTNPLTGLQYTDVRHVPLLRTIWDRSESTISRSKYIAFAHYVPEDDAVEIYGSKVRQYAQTMVGSSMNDAYRTIRILEYFDIGFGKNGIASRALIPGDIHEKPLFVEDSFTDVLPVAQYEHFLPPGIDRAVGVVSMAMASQEQRNKIERILNDKIGRKQATIIKSDLLDADDLAQINRGASVPVVQAVGNVLSGEEVVWDIPGGSIEAIDMQLLQMTDQELNAILGVNDFDRGNQPDKDRTLGESQLIDARSKNNATWAMYQTTLMLQRAVEKVCHIAGIADTDQIQVSVEGFPIVINSTPALDITGFTSQPYQVVIGVESLTQTDAAQQTAQKLGEINALAAFIPFGMPPGYIVKQALEATGRDPNVVETEAQPAQMQPQQPGQGDPNAQQQP